MRSVPPRYTRTPAVLIVLSITTTSPSGTPRRRRSLGSSPIGASARACRSWRSYDAQLAGDRREARVDVDRDVERLAVGRRSPRPRRSRRGLRSGSRSRSRASRRRRRAGRDAREASAASCTSPNSRNRRRDQAGRRRTSSRPARARRSRTGSCTAASTDVADACRSPCRSRRPCRARAAAKFVEQAARDVDFVPTA